MSIRSYFTDASQSKYTTFGFVCLSGKTRIKDSVIYRADDNLSINYAEAFGIIEALNAIQTNDILKEYDNYIITDSNEVYLQILHFLNVYTDKSPILNQDRVDEFYAPIANQILELNWSGYKLEMFLVKSHAGFESQKEWLSTYGFNIPDNWINFLNFGNGIIDFMVNFASKADELAEIPKDIIKVYTKIDMSIYKSVNMEQLTNSLLTGKTVKNVKIGNQGFKDTIKQKTIKRVAKAAGIDKKKAKSLLKKGYTEKEIVKMNRKK